MLHPVCHARFYFILPLSFFILRLLVSPFLLVLFSVQYIGLLLCVTILLSNLNSSFSFKSLHLLHVKVKKTYRQALECNSLWRTSAVQLLPICPVNCDNKRSYKNAWRCSDVTNSNIESTARSMPRRVAFTVESPIWWLSGCFVPLSLQSRGFIKYFSEKQETGGEGKRN